MSLTTSIKKKLGGAGLSKLLGVNKKQELVEIVENTFTPVVIGVAISP